MKKIRLILVGILICPLVFAFPEPPNEDDMKEKREQFFQEIGVTPEQKEKIDALRENKKEFKEEFKEMRELRDQMQNLLKDPNTSDDTVLAKSKEIADKMSLAHEKRIKHLLEMKKILTADQFGKLLDKMHKKFEKMKGKFRE